MWPRGIQYLLNDRWASALLSAVWVVGTLAAPGCKPKSAGPSPDAGGRPVAGTPNTLSANLERAIHHFLTDKLARRPPCKGEQIIEVVRIGECTIKRSILGVTASGWMIVTMRTEMGNYGSADPFLCWVRQRGAAWTVMWCRVGQTSFGSGITPQSDIDASLGVDTCDALDAYTRCSAKKLPAPGGANLLRTLHVIRKAQRNSLKDPAARARIAKECGKTLEIIRKNAHKYPRYKDCVK